MKTPFAWMGLLFCLCVCACTPPEDEVHPKRRSARADNLQRYMNKAQHHRALAQARAKPLVERPLLPGDVLKEFLPQTHDLRISEPIALQKKALETSVKEAYARRAADQTSELITQFREEAVSAALSAQNPQELAARLNEVSASYSQKLAEFTQSQLQNSWAMADDSQSRLSRQALADAWEALLAAVSQDYGERCAQKTKPVLQKTADDYWLVLSSVTTPQELEQELARVAQQADLAFSAVAAEYGDPVLALSDSQAASLRARLIEAHQQVETQFEKLYGKEAVLQTRDIFEHYKNAADKLLHQPARLSQLQEKLFQAGETYRKEMTELQAQLNKSIERRAAEVRGIPLSAAGK